MDLTNDQWQIIQPLIPPPSKALRGRPPLDERAILNAILWKIRSRAPWYDLPASYPSHQTCYRRYRQWLRLGVLDSIFSVLYQDLCDRGGLDLQSALRDSTLGFFREEGRWQLEFDPLLEGTWQRSTAQLFLALALGKLRSTSR